MLGTARSGRDNSAPMMAGAAEDVLLYIYDSFRKTIEISVMMDSIIVDLVG